jgi:hypothetical protein
MVGWFAKTPKDRYERKSFGKGEERRGEVQENKKQVLGVGGFVRDPGLG